ncbi:tRNA-U20a,U20b-dihydrouridine synthase [Kushneria indalinina DSM 14324]|uniref:tRNA-dihydrouridine(16) synthase n=2 Tax=Kushneria indalinina TaxID=184067 RepID=A0A3D9DXP6_9GAMM|nr:tRNA-U20a,U20b-dihydrouridine synthase [Kushneria indalinina DSM 14324]
MPAMPPATATADTSRAGLIGLAPMEGVIDALTRELLTAPGGFDWSVTEFVRITDARLPPRVFQRICPELDRDSQTPGGTPVHLQLLGSQPDKLGENARVAAALGAPVIDMNFGCPAKTVNRHDGGAALLRSPERVYRAVQGVHEALEGTGVPVTAKLRLGFEDKTLALECARAAEDGGAQRLVVHARTRREGYRPPAHWEWVARIREQAGVPVVVNGDIWTLEEYWRAREVSGCQDVMLGRAALADPWLARRIRHWQQTGERLPATRWQDRSAFLAAYAQRIDPALPSKVVVSLLKQWLNIMRQHDSEAGEHFQRLRRITALEDFMMALQQETPLPETSAVIPD